MPIIASTCSASCLAALFHLSKGRVQQLARLGVVRRLRRGEYDLLASTAGYVAYLHAQVHCKKHGVRMPRAVKPGSGDALSLIVRRMADILRSQSNIQESSC